MQGITTLSEVSPLPPDDLVSRSPFASNPAYDLQEQLSTPDHFGIDDDDKPAPSLLQLFLRRVIAYFKRAIWTRFLSTLRYLLPLLLLIVVFTSHYGVFLFTNVFMLSAIGVLAVLGGAKGRRDALYLGIIYVLALVAAIFIYYSHFASIIGTQFSQSFGGSSPSNTPKKAFDLVATLKQLYLQARDDFGLLILFPAVGGIALWLVSWWQAAFPDQSKIPTQWRQRFATVVFGRMTPLNALLVALFATGLFFAVLSQVIGLESRYQLYLLPLVSLATGALLGRVWRSSFAGILLVSALFLFQLLTVLTFWLGRLTYYPG